jgi:transposase
MIMATFLIIFWLFLFAFFWRSTTGYVRTTILQYRLQRHVGTWNELDAKLKRKSHTVIFPARKLALRFLWLGLIWLVVPVITIWAAIVFLP